MHGQAGTPVRIDLIRRRVDSEPPELPDLDGASAQEVLSWAMERFFPAVAVACSMQDAVVVDLAWRVEPRTEVFFLDTGFHFPETLATADRMRRRYDLNLVTLRPRERAAVYRDDGFDACCADRKIAPMEQYLETKRAWISGIRRAESPTRSGARAVEWDARRRLVKVNPIVGWTDDDVARYIVDHDVIVNPLAGRGYDSIGCAPCTLPGRGREGRWAGVGQLECGLHLPPPTEKVPEGVAGAL